MSITTCAEACQLAATFYEYQIQDIYSWPSTGRDQADEIRSFVESHPECGYVVPRPFNPTACEPETIDGSPLYNSYFTQTRGPEADKITLQLVCFYNPCYNIEGEPPCPIPGTTPQYDVYLNCPDPGCDCCDCGCDC